LIEEVVPGKMNHNSGGDRFFTTGKRERNPDTKLLKWLKKKEDGVGFFRKNKEGKMRRERGLMHLSAVGGRLGHGVV